MRAEDRAAGSTERRSPTSHPAGRSRPASTSSRATSSASQFGPEHKTAPAAFHLIDMLRALPEAYVLVMAYRNFTSGPDGSIAHVRSEFDYASQVEAACGIVVGQEFGRVYPEKLSFWWAGRAAFRQAAEEITRPTASARSSAACRSTT